MGIAYRYLADDDLTVTVWAGPVTREYWETYLRGCMDDPQWFAAKRRLTDTTAADTAGITAADVAIVASNLNEAVPARGQKVAIVAAASWDLAKVAEGQYLKDGASAIQFTNVRTACAWLGVDATRVARAVRELQAELRDD